MATKYNTGNPIGSADPRDLNDNSVNIDEWVNSQSKNSHPDRLGAPRRTWHGMENEFDDALDSYQVQVNDLVIAGGKIFPNEAAGRALVNDGQYFYTESDDPDVSKVLWRRIDADNSELIAEDPSAEFLATILEEQLLQRQKLNLISTQDLPGVAFALLDSLGNAALVLDENGRLRVQEMNVGGAIAQVEQAISDFVFILKDRLGNAALGLRGDGALVVDKLIAREIEGEGSTPIAGASRKDKYLRGGELLPAHVDLTKAVAWGSSSVARSLVPFGNLFNGLGADYYNGGNGGSRADIIAAKIGSVPALLTFPNNTVPASGTVSVSVSNVVGRTGDQPYNGSVAGVAGVLQSSNEGFTFERNQEGDSVDVDESTPFIPAEGVRNRNSVTVLWMGKNDISQGIDPELTIALTDKSFDYLSPLFPRCIVLGHYANANWFPESNPDGLNIRRLNYVNAAHEERYGNLFIDTQAFIRSTRLWEVTGITPTPQDLEQQSNGLLPPSVAADNGHLTSVGYTAIATLIDERMNELKWF